MMSDSNFIKPANFLDGGGGANKANSRLAIETLNRDPDVKAIFVNSEFYDDCTAPDLSELLLFS
jgi:succinyl-CoA synthetase beta subunit